MLSSFIILPRIPIKFLAGYSNFTGWLAFLCFCGVAISLLSMLHRGLISAPRKLERTFSNIFSVVIEAFIIGFVVWAFAFGCESFLDAFVFKQEAFYHGWMKRDNIVVFRGLFPAFMGGGSWAGFAYAWHLMGSEEERFSTRISLLSAFFGCCLGGLVAGLIWVPWAFALLFQGIVT